MSPEVFQSIKNRLLSLFRQLEKTRNKITLVIMIITKKKFTTK